MRDAFRSILSDTMVIDELKAQPDSIAEVVATAVGDAVSTEEPDLRELATATSPTGRLLEIVEELQGGASLPDTSVAEAIVRHFGRPVLLIKDGKFEQPQSRVWQQRLGNAQPRLGPMIAATGRVEILYHPSYQWLGTGFVVDEGVVLTNRHVAEIFAERLGPRRFAFRRNVLGVPMGARLDFREEHGTGAQEEVEIAEILHVEDAGSELPDLAILRLTSGQALPTPVSFSVAVAEQQMVATVGYPARDGRRNDPAAMNRIFGDIYDVKRLAPGQVMDVGHDRVFTHDCTTLGGNSGSGVIDIETGKVVGLHYAGRRETANFAVRAHVLTDRLRRVLISNADVTAVEERPVPTGRGGYDEGFLGQGAVVRLPKLDRAIAGKAARIKRNFEGAGSPVIPYTNFSIVMNKERRLAFFTAVNIDGGNLHRIPRQRDVWSLDPRISAKHQLDNALYSANDLDRGHLVRRLDPMWGSRRQAKQAQDDTFHYTNAAPQHKDLNRDIWVDLEDYLLDRTDQHDLKISVFTGPVFLDHDPPYRGLTHIPRQYWKVVAFRRRRGGLAATAYLLSQSQMISDLEAPFGAFRTYQVGIGAIESLTGLDFGVLRKVDPLAHLESAGEGRMLESAEQILL
jgi:endonuclease G